MNARENDREKGNEKEIREEREKSWSGWANALTTIALYYRLTYWKNREPYTHTSIYIHWAVANFLFHFNV
jgi:hypothetical protein